VYASFCAIRQIDIKRIIAYSSIAHVNMSIIGFISMNVYGVIGAYASMIAHSFSSAALFVLAGILYERFHVRLLNYYRGLTVVMPLFSTFFFIHCAGNFSFPGSLNFLGEFFIFLSIGSQSSMFILVCLIASTTAVLTYNLILFNNICFGTLDTNYFSRFTDLDKYETAVLSFLTLVLFTLGIVPQIFFDTLVLGATCIVHR